MAKGPLTCPRCATSHDLDERFCPDCHMPLIYSGAHGLQAPVTATQERARKIKPRYAEGRLVRAAGARNQAEAEFIQGLLLEEGVPSIVQRARGFDVPDFLAGGFRDVMVPESGLAAAREVLLESELLGDQASAGPRPWPLLAGLLVGVAVVALLAWLITQG